MANQKNINKKVTSNKLKHTLIEDKLKEVQDEIKILLTYDSSLSFIFLSAKVTFSMMEEHNLA